MNQLQPDTDIARSTSTQNRPTTRQSAPPEPGRVVAIEFIERDTANIPSPCALSNPTDTVPPREYGDRLAIGRECGGSG
jgi:hypothetical protein